MWQFYATQKLQQLGAKVVAMSDSNGFIYDADGIDLAAMKEIKEVKRGRVKITLAYRPNAKYTEGKGIWNIKMRSRVPCATERIK